MLRSSYRIKSYNKCPDEIFQIHFCMKPFFHWMSVNSFPPSAAYMRQWTGSAFSDNGLSPVRRQAITWTITGLLPTGFLGTNFSENRFGILSFSFKKMHLKLSFAKVAAILSRGRWVKHILKFGNLGQMNTYQGLDSLQRLFQLNE